MFLETKMEQIGAGAPRTRQTEKKNVQIAYLEANKQQQRYRLTYLEVSKKAKRYD